MFAYCGNNPIVLSDAAGDIPYHLDINGESQPDERPFKPINGQELYPYDSMPYGTGTIGENGCSAVATYNALNLSGIRIEFDTVISYYEWSWYFLHHGTPSWLIGSCLSMFGAEWTYSYEASIIEQCKNGGAVIVNVYNKVRTVSFCTVPGFGHEKSLWTTAVFPDLSAGSHSVAISYRDGQYYVYNYYDLTRNPYIVSDYSDYLKGRGFRDAYYISPKN